MKNEIYKLTNPQGKYVGIATSIMQVANVIGATYEAARLAIRQRRPCKDWLIEPIKLSPEQLLMKDIFQK